MARLQHIITPPPTSSQGIPRGKNKGARGKSRKSKGGVILAKKEKGLAGQFRGEEEEEEKEEREGGRVREGGNGERGILGVIGLCEVKTT